MTLVALGCDITDFVSLFHIWRYSMSLSSWFGFSRRPPLTRRTTLSLEFLEDRLAPALLKVVPSLGANGVNTFASLQQAVDAAQTTDLIQVEPGSTPGTVLPSVQKTVTIQGDPALGGATGLQATGSIIASLELAANNVTLANLFLGSVTIDINITGQTITNSILTGARGGITQLYSNTTAPHSVTNGHNTISGNRFLDGASLKLGNTPGNSNNTSSNDTVSNNVFLNTGLSPVDIEGESSNLSITGNRIESSNGSEELVGLFDDVGTVSGNLIRGNGLVNSAIVISDLGASDELPSNVQVQSNVFVVPEGAGIRVIHHSVANTFSVSALNNTLAGSKVGISVAGDSAGGNNDFGSISISGNDLRGNTGLSGQFAIQVVNIRQNTSTITARRNIFSVANPQTVVDVSNAPGTTVDTSNPLTGGAANLTAMFQSLGGGPPTAAQHTALDGASAATQAQAAIRSAQAATTLVDGLFVSLLGRAPATGEDQGFVNAVEHGLTEEQLISAFVSSPEYFGKIAQGSPFPNGAWVQSLYLNLLGREGSAAEINGWLAVIPSGGLAAVANGIVNSPEFRSIQIQAMYGATTVSIIPTPDILKRTALASPADVNNWALAGFDLLAIEAIFLASGEFVANG
jgi:hypothetical protein